MARKRDISPGIWGSLQFMACSLLERLLFIGCISNADDEGRLYGDPAWLKANIFPGDSVSLKRIEQARDRLVELGLLKLYHDESGTPLLWIPTWKRHQTINRRYPSHLPPHPEDTAKPKRRRKNSVDPL